MLAHAGVDSRRACEDLILQGRVTVDGKVARELGTRVDPENSRIEVDGERIQIEKHVYYAVNKPKGYVSTNDDPSGRPRVIDLIPEIPQRVYTVGRLDEDSTGLILLTNDGEMAHRLAHPRYGVEKLYKILVAGLPSQEALNRVTDGVWLADGKVRAKRVKITGRQGEATTLELVLAEGKNREVRRIFAKLGHKVMSLTRIAVGPILLKGLGMGEFRPLTKDEVELLKKAAAGILVGPARSRDRRPPAKGPAGKRDDRKHAEASSPPSFSTKVQGGAVPGKPAPGASPAPSPSATKPPGKIVPNMILPSGAVVGARPGTGPGAGSGQRPQRGPAASGPGGGDRGRYRDQGSDGPRERRPKGPSGVRGPHAPKSNRDQRYSTGSGSGEGGPSSTGSRPPRQSYQTRQQQPPRQNQQSSSEQGERQQQGRRIIGIDANLLQSNDRRRKTGGSGATGGGKKTGGGAGSHESTGAGQGGEGSGARKPKQRRPPRAAHGVKRKPRDGRR